MARVGKTSMKRTGTGQSATLAIPLPGFDPEKTLLKKVSAYLGFSGMSAKCIQRPRASYLTAKFRGEALILPAEL